MADYVPDVRLIGTVTDIDGYELAVGVDHDTVTLGTPHALGAWARFDRPNRVGLWRLLQDGAIAVGQYERRRDQEAADER